MGDHSQAAGDAYENARGARVREITVFTDAGDWPTVDTSALRARFRTDAFSGGIQKWSIERYCRLFEVAVGSAPGPGLYRIVTDEGDGRTWLATPEYRRLAALTKPAVDPKPSLFSDGLSAGIAVADALRVGRGRLRWPRACQVRYPPFLPVMPAWHEPGLESRAGDGKRCLTALASPKASRTSASIR